MSLTDQEFRHQHEPLHVPSSYNRAESGQDKIIFALADLGEASADQVVKRLEQFDPGNDTKPLIAAVHETLTLLYEQGRIAAEERDGDLIYNLHKITQANSGGVNPDLLAPGLD